MLHLGGKLNYFASIIMETNNRSWRIRSFCAFKLLITIALQLNSKDIKAQENFSVGNFFEIFDQDSIKVYYNSMGQMDNKKKALYFRIGKRDKKCMNFANEFKDYDMDGNVFFKGFMINDFLNGWAQYFHANGLVKEEGNYKDDHRIGTWKYYHPNGKLSMVISFENGQIIIKEAYSKNGSKTVDNGNGKVSLTVSKFRQSTTYQATGRLQNGEMTGTWKLNSPELNYTIAIEEFKDGKFIKGENSSLMLGSQIYKDRSNIMLTNYYPGEALNLALGHPIPLGHSYGRPEYKGMLLEKNIYALLLDSINGKYSYALEDQWVIVAMKINPNDSISDVKVSSSIHDTKFNEFILKTFTTSTGWGSARLDGKKVSSDLMISLLVKDKKIILPAYFFNPMSTKLEKDWSHVLRELPAYDDK